jgi:hypothetical protein
MLTVRDDSRKLMRCARDDSAVLLFRNEAFSSPDK